VRITPAIGNTTTANLGELTSSPSTAESTEIARVITRSP
jgi:hypothetical protein